MKNKQLIQVLNNSGNCIETIARIVRFEAIGNFCPGFATYNNKQHLVRSRCGDLSDPFRANEQYLESLYIQLD